MINIQDDLNDISKWFKTNRLALNESKTKFIIFHRFFNKPPDTFKIVLNNVELERKRRQQLQAARREQRLQRKVSFNKRIIYASYGVITLRKYYKCLY